MKVLLLTDVPPCTNYTAGMVLGQIIKVLPRGSVACFCVLNPDINNIASDPELDWMPLEYATKPRETGLPADTRMRGLRSYVIEQARNFVATPGLVNLIVDFARRQSVDAIWAVLQGQTMVRLCGRITQRLRMPLFTHVWDPLKWWLDANGVDPRSGRIVQAEFDSAIRQSSAVATASPAMSADYERRYGVRSVALIACHDRKDSYMPPPRPHRDGELVVGMAGQFYANAEWQTLVRTLNLTDWIVGERSVRLLVLGHYIPDSPIPEGRSTFLGWQSQKDTIRILAEQADVLFCPYPFDPSMAEVSRLSFPSKLVSYFAAGRPIILHGSQDSSPARYLREHEAGIVTQGSGASNIHNVLSRLATDQDFFATLAVGAQRTFITEFTLERMRERALEFFATDIEALTAAAPALVPFDPGSPAARRPPPRQIQSGSIRLRRALVAVAMRTPAAPLADKTARAVRAYYRWKRRRTESKPLWSALQQVRALGSELTGLRADFAVQREEFEAKIEAARHELEAALHELEAARHELEAAQHEKAQLREASTALVQSAESRAAVDQRRLEAALHRNALLTAENAAHRHQWEGSVAVLTQQLQGANAAYAQLAETHAALNRRFDSVASSIMGKLSLLDDRIQRMGDPAPRNAVGGSGSVKYLDLLESVLTGSASSDQSVSPWTSPGYSAETRLLGRDWPEHALTMIGTVRMRNIRQLVETILREGTLGDLVETGVWRGGACLYMRAILAENGVVDRTVWLADSFRGLPEPDAEDFPADAGDTHHTHPVLAVSADDVRANFAKFGLLDEQVRILEGWFKDTLPTAPIEQIALLRLDGDMYESTWQALEALYHKVSPGGFIIVDDYVLPACAKAVDDWRLSRGCSETLNEVDGAAVYWRKA